MVDEYRERKAPKQVVVAGKGGVGKTTVAAALVQCMSHMGLRVLAVDADPTALLGSYLGVTLRGTAGAAAARARHLARSGMISRPRELAESEIKRSLVRTRYGELVTLGALSGPGCYCASNSVLRAVLKDLRGEGSSSGELCHTRASSHAYDIVLVDCEPGLEVFSRGTLDDADEILVVAEPTAAGICVAGQIWEAASALELRAARHGSARKVLLNKVKSFAGSLHHGAAVPSINNADCQQRGELELPPDISITLARYGLEASELLPYEEVLGILSNSALHIDLDRAPHFAGRISNIAHRLAR